MPSHRLTNVRAAVAAFVLLSCLPPEARLLAQGTLGAASGNNYVREVVDPDLGLPDTQVSAITQTADGYLWLGTRRGLVRFDGMRATSYSPQNTPALRSWTINALNADATGALWISTDRGLTVYERGTFRHVSPDQIPAGVVWKVLRDTRGRIWVSGSFGVRVGDGTRFTPVPHLDDHVYAVVEDHRQRLWFGGRRVLASYSEGDSAPVRWAPGEQQRIYDLAVDSARTLWIALREGARQLSIADYRNVTEIRRVPTAVGEVRSQVWSLAVAPDGALMLGTDTRGVLRWDGRTLVELDENGRRPADPVWWISHDSRGNTWAGTSGGLLRYRRSAFRTIVAGLAAPGTWSIRGDRDGTPWVSADDGQVAWFDGNRWHPVFSKLVNRAAPSIWPSFSGGMLIADDEGHLLRATRTRVSDVTKAVGLPAVDAYGVFEDADGTVYNGTGQGFLRARGGYVDSVYRDVGLSSDDEPRVFMRSARGELLVGNPFLTIGEGGSRKRYRPADGLTDGDVMALHETPGALWIATADSGLFVLRNGRVFSFEGANFRLNRGLNGITDDQRGYLWLTSRAGLMRVAIADLLAAADGTRRVVGVRQFDRADGLPTTDFNADFQSQIYRDARGQLWLPTYAGPVVFDPAAVVEDTIPPQVHVEGISIDGVMQSRRDSVRSAGHPGRVEVNFAATNALVPGRVRAEYRVVGISDQWIDAGRRRTLTFGPLSGGDYRLEIRVAGEDGNGQPRIAVAQLTVPKSLTEQAWFFPLVALTTGLGAFAFTRWRLASARARRGAFPTRLTAHG